MFPTGFTYTEEILNRKLHFLCNEYCYYYLAHFRSLRLLFGGCLITMHSGKK